MNDLIYHKGQKEHFFGWERGSSTLERGLKEKPSTWMSARFFLITPNSISL